jgi:hypothetical protein
MNADSKTSIKSFLRHQRPLLRKDSSFVRTIVDGDGYITIPFKPSSTKSQVTRTRIENGEHYTAQKRPLEPYVKSMSLAMHQPLSGTERNIVNFKAAAFSTPTRNRMGSSINVKVGLIGSSGTIGQGVQAAGTVALPGDLSGIRSPIRSRAYSALIPGGNTGLGKLRRVTPKPTRGYRCPAGFQFGGRFTDSRYSTCGAQLFDIPSPLGIAIGVARRLNNKPKLPNSEATSLSEVVTGGSGASTASILRMAQIPRTGADRPAERMKAVETAIRTVTGAPTSEGRLIRRDAVVLKPIVPSSVLRKFSGNSDMDGSVMVRPIQVPKDIVGDDLGLLSGPAVRQVTYVMPNGSTLTIERARDLTVGERRKFGRQLNRVAGESDQFDVGNNIRDFANSSGGAFKYTEKFPNIDKPNDLISVDNGRGGKVEVRRWVYETFMSNGKGKGKIKPVSAVANTETVREDATPKNDSPATLAEAIKMLDNGGDPFDIPSEFISAALKNSKSYKSTPLGTGIVKHQAGSGKSVLQVPETVQNGSVAEKVYADIASHVGLKMPNTKIGGSASKRDIIMNDVSQGETRFDTSVELDKVSKGDILRASIADFLTDRRGRSPATLTPVRDGSRITVLPSSNELSNMAGLTAAEIARRFKIDLPDYMDERGSRFYKQSLGSSSESERKMLASLVDDIFKKIDAFNWDEYLSRLSIDGMLSDAEKRHLEIVKRLFTTRRETLKKQKLQFNKLIGI